MAAAWAVVRHLGRDGYRRLVRATLEAADRIRAGVRAVDGLSVPGDPRHHLLSITADPAAEEPVNIPALGEALAARHWHLDRQGPPDGLHLTVSAGNVPTVNEWLADLSDAVVEARERGNIDPADDGSYATLE